MRDMIKDWNNLRYLWALREGGTMRRAAEMLGTSPTTVSRHIRTLTEEFGQILALQTRGEDWTITPEGNKLVDLAADFNRKVASLDRQKPTDKHPSISITSLDFVLTYYLAPHISGLLEKTPYLNVALLSSDRRLSLAFNEVDLALRFGRPEEGQLVTKKLYTVNMRIWQPVRGGTIHWVGMSEDLDWTPDMKMARDFFGCAPTVRTSSYSAAKQAAIDLGYCTIGPDVVMADCPHLVEAPGGTTVAREIWSVIHESRRHDQNLIATKQWLEGLFAQQKGQSGRPDLVDPQTALSIR